ncbi:hypothetical protein ACFWD7_06145 [Streptomyces mirabilis]|uniref:hypothetical protein n=1 Tax=Streptomyces mirabilis TaxID=68239 RepID=UPI003679E636
MTRRTVGPAVTGADRAAHPTTPPLEQTMPETTDPQPETALALLYRHGVPEDVIDGALCLHAQELAAQIRNHPGAIPYRPQLDEDGGFWWDLRDRDAAAALIDPAATDAAAPSAPADRAALSAKLWAVAEHHIVAEWICCEPVNPKHELCSKGQSALDMVRSLLVDADPAEAWNPSAPLLDAVLAELCRIADGTGPDRCSGCRYVPCGDCQPAVEAPAPSRAGGETQQGEAEATESVIYQVVGDWGVESADDAAEARAAVASWLSDHPHSGAHAEQRIYREWPDGSEFYGPWTDLPNAPTA